jgi:hypothetical protein
MTGKRDWVAVRARGEVERRLQHSARANQSRSLHLNPCLIQDLEATLGEFAWQEDHRGFTYTSNRVSVSRVGVLITAQGRDKV